MINVKSLEVGDKVRTPIFPEREPLTGTVIYIHPERRFFRVRVETECGPLTESFCMEGPLAVSSERNQVKEEY